MATVGAKYKSIKASFLFFFCTWQGFTLFPRATVKSIAAETNNWKITFINSGKRMFELSGIAEKLGCASAGTVSTFACVGPVYKCNIDIRLTGLLTFSRVGDSQQEVCGKKFQIAQAAVVLCHATVYLENLSSQYSCRWALRFSWSKAICLMMFLKPELYWLHPLSDLSITAWFLYRKTQDRKRSNHKW